jgi:hypothetical protein
MAVDPKEAVRKGEVAKLRQAIAKVMPPKDEDFEGPDLKFKKPLFEKPKEPPSVKPLLDRLANKGGKTRRRRATKHHSKKHRKTRKH